MSLTVGRLARRFGLSRTALLYYDRLGLLSPSGRTSAGYRVYSPADEARLEAICRYRAVGLSLEQIHSVLDDGGGRTVQLLEARLDALNAEVAKLRAQQRVIVQLLSKRSKLKRTRALDKARWVEILRAAGLDDAAMHQWHIEFERQAPEAHQDFLESLGLASGEVRRIRRWSR